MSNTNDKLLCKHCGKRKNNSKHVQYGNDLDNPVKHKFEAELDLELGDKVVYKYEESGGYKHLDGQLAVVVEIHPIDDLPFLIYFFEQKVFMRCYREELEKK